MGLSVGTYYPSVSLFHAKATANFGPKFANLKIPSDFEERKTRSLHPIAVIFSHMSVLSDLTAKPASDLVDLCE